jgi:hypothetical protein
MRSRTVRRGRDVEGMGRTQMSRIFVGKCQGRRLLGRSGINTIIILKRISKKWDEIN